MRAIPLCVDLDGTLLRTDMLWEGIAQLLRSPIQLLRALVTLGMGGKVAFKEAVALATKFDPSTMPYRTEVLGFVREQAGYGREVVLATAAHRNIAEQIARHFGLFSRVIATGDGCNLSGNAKKTALEANYGCAGFDYIGDSHKDLPVFLAARHAYLVNPTPAVLSEVKSRGKLTRVFIDKQPFSQSAARELRLHQWAKNVLLFVPMIAAHQIFDMHMLMSALLAFFGFGLVASATYLVNDLVDLSADRSHEKKKYRPLASGFLSIRDALILITGLGMAGMSLSVAFLPLTYISLLLVYVLLTLAYSFDLKRRLLVDALTLALLYTLRILAGAAATAIVVSQWLLMFSLFVFLSLAFLKRLIEFNDTNSAERLIGRAYRPTDLETIRSIGVAAGLMSVLVLMLYIGSPAVSELYRAPGWLWLLSPLLIYWIARIWFLAGRGEVHHDPVVFALLDKRSYAVLVLAIVVISCAKYGVAAYIDVILS